MKHDHALAVDIGGTKIALCAINEAGQVTSKPEEHPIPFDTQHVASVEEILCIVSDRAAALTEEGKLVGGIGVSICGSVDPVDDRVLFVPNLYWGNTPLREKLMERTSLPVFIDQDTRTAALGESRWGIAKGVNDFLWITIGTGVGAALFINGKLHGGAHGFSGWLGHSTVDEVNGIACSCGRRGCLETYVAGPGIARLAREAVENDSGKGMLKFAAGRELRADVVFKAAAAGEKTAKKIIDHSINILAKGLGLVVNVLDLTLIILGGGVVKYSPEMVALVKEVIPPYVVGKEVLADLRIVSESLPNAALHGAGALVFTRLEKSSR